MRRAHVSLGGRRCRDSPAPVPAPTPSTRVDSIRAPGIQDPAAIVRAMRPNPREPPSIGGPRRWEHFTPQLSASPALEHHVTRHLAAAGTVHKHVERRHWIQGRDRGERNVAPRAITQISSRGLGRTAPSARARQRWLRPASARPTSTVRLARRKPCARYCLSDRRGWSHSAKAGRHNPARVVRPKPYPCASPGSTEASRVPSRRSRRFLWK